MHSVFMVLFSSPSVLFSRWIPRSQGIELGLYHTTQHRRRSDTQKKKNTTTSDEQHEDNLNACDALLQSLLGL